ncbi:hypothetical protein EON81_05510 [bacterium]|nr:MAG: hypothetical protein EON81_05510 [bacterium]
MSNEALIALISAASTLAGALVSQLVGIYYQGRMNNLERIRLVQARAGQLYDREIKAYDAIVPAMSALLYVAREMAKKPLLRQHRLNDEESLAGYRELQDRARAAVDGHLKACAENFHVIGPKAVNKIDAGAIKLYRIIDELSAPISGGSPASPARADEILLELEALRGAMLVEFWNALDTMALESSFEAVHQPLRKDPVRSPDILDVDIQAEPFRLEGSHVLS